MSSTGKLITPRVHEGHVLQGFPHPSPTGKHPRIRPCFLPFAGCPSRCTFCNQHAITGHGPDPLPAIYDALQKELATDARPMELAFYGGTFTALPAPWPQTFLELASLYRAKGQITRVRCSTRPDALGDAVLGLLHQHGLELIELGIQSFEDPSLTATRRGYTRETAINGCKRVQNQGFDLGIQLMPGLPGQDPEGFKRDVSLALELHPVCVRLYPAMVLKGTVMATQWAKEEYQPWSLEQTVESVGEAMARFWEAGVSVIRVGLPPEPGLENYILDGPGHPALGQLVRSQALFAHIKGRLRGQTATELLAPKRWQSDILGHKRSLIPYWQSLGISENHLCFHTGDLFYVR